MAVIDDLAVQPDENRENYALIPLTQDLLHVLLPIDHALARRDSLTIAELRDAGVAITTSDALVG